MDNNNMERFDHIQHQPLQVYNRVALMFNLKEDFGLEVAQEYASQFTEQERAYMFAMGKYIQVNGLEEMRKQVTAGVEPTYDVGVE